MAHLVGKDKILTTLNNYYKRASIEKGLKTAALRVEKSAKEIAPAGDGSLRASITHAIDVGGMSAEIGTPLHYAPYVEYGTGIYAVKGDGRQTPWSYKDDEGNWHSTVGQHAHPFLGKALKKNRKKIKQDIIQAMLGGMKR